MRRLAVLREQLDPALAAHIVGEVCAGLHAAHELRDAQGTPVNLVHRDVNPNNVFIGYDGSVKLLDFGVAKAADRISRTEAGQIKGKYPYMSPEQCRGKPLDRRSDVFALGITLYEIASGCRLFARPSEMLVFRAICRERIPALSEARADAPESLGKVCEKALERRREQRYASALDMRRDLSKIVATTPSDDAPGERLAALMQRAFSDRIEEKSELMRCVKSGSTLTSIPLAESDLGVELPTAITTFGAETTDGGSLAPPPRRARAWLFLAAVVAVIALAAFVVRRREPAPTSTNVTASSPIALAIQSAAPTAPREVVLSISTEPAGARVSVDGKAEGTSPTRVRVAKGERAVDVLLESEGFGTRRESVVPNRDRDLSFSLTRPTKSEMRTTKKASTPSQPSATAAPTSSAPKGYYRF
jgi:serine/threonine protein kinase